MYTNVYLYVKLYCNELFITIYMNVYVNVKLYVFLIPMHQNDIRKGKQNCIVLTTRG